MSDRAPLFSGERSDSVLSLRPESTGYADSPDTFDALSHPDLDEITRSLTGLLPPGAAWRTPDASSFEEGSHLGLLWRAIATQFCELYSRVFDLSSDSTASTIVNGLADWESEFGLPDPCFGENQSRQQRLRSLLLKVRSAATLTVHDFIALAASAGYEITIHEPMSFACGESGCGNIDQMGGDQEFYWIVRVVGVPIDYFECGISECGIDHLTDFGAASDLECLFRRIAPGWTRPIFSYS
jgi:uncharacterized protein YmfQ (DUF2313 family)